MFTETNRTVYWIVYSVYIHVCPSQNRVLQGCPAQYRFHKSLSYTKYCSQVFKVEQDCHTPLKVSQDLLSSHIIDRFKYLFSLIL